MKITKYKKIRNKYRVYFENDNSIDLYESIILNNNLLLKTEINDDVLKKIKEENDKEEAYEVSLNYLNTKMRTKTEIKKYLVNKKFNNEDVEYALNRLEKNGFINDELYIKAYIIDKINLTNDGPNKIKLKLINENMDEQLIKKYIDQIDEKQIEDKLNRLMDKKIKSIKNCSGFILKQKIVSYFYNLGYSREMIDKIISTKNVTNSLNGEREYKKIYDKYSKKYEGYELESIIRQKLYSKGFDYDEIKKNI